jgi:hypothetical protein
MNGAWETERVDVAPPRVRPETPAHLAESLATLGRKR